MTRLNLGVLFDPRFDILPPKILLDEPGFVRVSSLNGKQPVRIPVEMTGELAYLIGIIIGDGYVSRAAKRKSHGSGFYWKIVVTGPHDYLVRLRSMFFRNFGVHGGLVRDRRKENTWQLRFANLVLHRFFTRVIGLPQGRKTTHGSWTRFEMVKGFPLYFLAGLMDSDGYVGKRYIGIVQKRFRFLVRVKRFANETLGLNFRGPSINRKLNGKVAGWIISIYKKEERTRLLCAIAQLEIGIKKADKRLYRKHRGLYGGPVAQYG